MQHFSMDTFSGSIVVDATGKKLRQFRPDHVVQDGEYVCVPSPAFTMVWNNKGQTVRLGDAAMKAATAACLTFDAAAHRPGYRMPSRDRAEFSDGAYAARKYLLSNAWRTAQG